MAAEAEAAAREALYRLFAQVFLDAPSGELFAALADPGLAEAAEAAGGAATGAALRAMQDGTASEEGRAAARVDATQLFIANRPLPAPPWESVYRGPERELFGPPAAEALRAYAEAGVVFDGWKDRPADHVGLELAFMAEVISRGVNAGSGGARGAETSFLRERLLGWAPAFCTRVEENARTPFYRAAAAGLRAFLAAEAARASS
jgi:TorA maturation chaperone TorD